MKVFLFFASLGFIVTTVMVFKIFRKRRKPEYDARTEWESKNFML